MRHAARILSIGILLSALGTVSVGCGDASAQPATTSLGVIDALAAEPLGTAQRAALYADVARADVAGVNALLRQATALRDPATQTFAFDVLLTRYSELDAGGAVAAANKLGVSPWNLAPLYQAWLRASPAAALAGLAKLDENQAASIAPGLLARVASDDELVAEILAAIPRPVADRYAASSIAKLAQSAPAEALERAQGISNPGLRTDTVNSVLRTWAAREPRTLLDYLATLDDAARRTAMAGGFWYQIASNEPELALDRVALFPPELRASIAVAAIPAIAQRDPLAAYARAAQLPEGQERRQVVQQIARSFAQRDADGALAWAKSLQPPEPEVLAVVVTGIAEKDPLRALDLAASIGPLMEQQQAMQSIVMNAIGRDPSLSSALLQRVLALPNEAQRQALVQQVVMSWASKEPARAADWLIANADRAPPSAIMSVASQFALLDLEQAAAYANRVPSQSRGAWLRGVASGYASSDPRGALNWVEQFRGSPEYEDAAFAVIVPAARVDPETAARAAEGLGRDDYRRSAISQVAMQWAMRDPAQAATWAAGLSDQSSRASATMTVASFWSNQDPQAARVWASGQPAGPVRDTALLAVIGNTARLETFDDSLLTGISDERTRLAATQGAAMGIAQRDPAAAREFIETHVADQTQRERMLAALGQLQAVRQGGGALSSVTGAVLSLPPPPSLGVACTPASAGPCLSGFSAPAFVVGPGGVTYGPPIVRSVQGAGVTSLPPPAQAPAQEPSTAPGPPPPRPPPGASSYKAGPATNPQQ